MVRSLASVLGMAAVAALLASPALAMSVSPSAGDAAKGAAVFQRCAMCHTADQGAGNRLGPNLFDVVGRKSAALPNFSYSTALKSSGITWTDDKLAQWVANPQKLVPGTRMTFAGLSNPDDVHNVIAYLHTKK
ncbi:MAG: cytochrome c family protein [Alphaproteobacteria bacterium]|nr:cytochrome c family protein [Alphaproteobacteria bacterium]